MKYIEGFSEDVPGLLINLYDYMNDEFIDSLLVNVAILSKEFQSMWFLTL